MRWNIEAEDLTWVIDRLFKIKLLKRENDEQRNIVSDWTALLTVWYVSSQAKGTKSTLFQGYKFHFVPYISIWNEVDFVPMACIDVLCLLI